MSYLQFIDAGTSKSGKTRIWSVLNTGGESLGEIHWKPTWRKYVFASHSTVAEFDSVCLSEISAFISNETRRHKDSA